VGYEYEIFAPESSSPEAPDLRMVPADEYLKTWNVPILESSSSAPPENKELEKLLEEYHHNAMGKQVESSDAHASSSPPPPENKELEKLLEEYHHNAMGKQVESSDAQASLSPAPPENEELEKLLEEYHHNAMGKPVESSDAHASSSSVPNPASSTANPDPLVEPTGPSAAAATPMQGS
jgi:hypothetical protein